VTWLVSDGKHGKPTEEYIAISHARWLGVAPWDYIGAPETAGDPAWFAWTNEAIAADAEAARQRQHTQELAAKHRPRKHR
jgi:hypothetical protein